jgi:hypothetical protein
MLEVSNKEISTPFWHVKKSVWGVIVQKAGFRKAGFGTVSPKSRLRKHPSSQVEAVLEDSSAQHRLPPATLLMPSSVRLSIGFK